jgi:uncharacterized protein (DUF1015 family)
MGQMTAGHDTMNNKDILQLEKEVISMADVRPLRGIRYVHEPVGDLAQVVTPPYDVISKEAQTRYYARNPYNIIRLELAQEESSDNTLNTVYTRAAATLSEWRLHNILRQDPVPYFYLYQQRFTHSRQTYIRTSLMGRVRLEPWSAQVVLRHEHTLAKAKEDRLHLLQACATNFSPIMSMYDDPQGRIRRLLNSYTAHPETQIVDEAGEEHSFQPITDAQHIALIRDFFSQRQLYVADGHHRYETALAYREEILAQRKALHPDDAVNFVMMALIDVDDPGMLVLPTHRTLFGLSGEALSKLSSEHFAQYFTIQPLGIAETTAGLLRRLKQAGETQPSFVLNTKDATWLLSLNEQGRRRMEQTGRTAAWNALDVAVAHTLVLEELLGMSAADMTAGKYVGYVQEADAALQAVQRGEAQVALLLNGTRVRQICDVALVDDRMPQKSTYFYPTLITGLVMNPLW